MKNYRVSIIDWSKNGKIITTITVKGIAEAKRFAKYWGIPTLEYHKDITAWQGFAYQTECIAFEI